MDFKKLGDFGEKIACKYLLGKGSKVLEKNYSRKWLSGPKKGEIDIVCKKDDVIIFVEVKTTAAAFNCGCFPEDRVNYKKQKQIIKTAQDWLQENKIPLDSKWQIDAVSVSVNLTTKKAKIRHFENISI